MVISLKIFFPFLLCRPFCRGLFFSFIFAGILVPAAFAQTEYVQEDNMVYRFLERMESLQLIKDYNSFEIPKTRKEVAGYLKQVFQNQNKLDAADIKIVEDLKTEFELELFGSADNSQTLIGSGDYNLFSEQQKYLFFLSDSAANIFVNILGEAEGIFLNGPAVRTSAFLPLIGGEIRGTFLDKFGFLLKGTNGFVMGSKTAAAARKDLAYNYKLFETEDDNFFDETEGYITADFDLIRFKFGRDRMKIGYGNIRAFLDDNSPLFDYLSFNLMYNFFTFSYFHGKILGDASVNNDTVTGAVNVIGEKYFGYHRIGFNISRHADFGLGEMIVYGDRPPDFSYINPFSFYKSIEHSNRDRDNAMLFMDFNNNSIKGLKLFFSLLVDDIKFQKIGTGWFGNQTAFNAGLKCYILYPVIPLDFQLEYLRIEPYTFTHRLSRNNFTSYGYNLGSFQQPNSELVCVQVNYRFNHRLFVSAGWIYVIHGANPVNTDGSVKENVGGNILLGHRSFDAEETKFLNGDLEYYRKLSVSLTYEPVNQYFFTLNVINFNNSLQQGNTFRETQSYLKLGVRF